MTNVQEIQSKFGSINWRDFLKGLLIAGIIPVVAILYKIISHWLDSSDEALVIDWKEVIRAAFYGFTAYLGKNFFEPTQTVIIVKPPVDVVPKDVPPIN
jgi:hypothetical protein